jgi:hypothetical protein
MLMKSILSTVLKLLLALGTHHAHAELKLDKAVPQKQAIQAIKPMQEKTIWPYAEGKTYVFDNGTPTGYRPNLAGGENKDSVFAWLLNGQHYLSYVVAYVPDNDPIEGCENYRRDDINWEGPNCYSINKAHLVCHIFMMTEQGQIAGIGRIQIGRDKKLIEGKPFCYDIKAMTAPKEIEDAMLITLSYIDSAAPAEPRDEPTEFPMTVLMRFKQEVDGKLTITQDDRCLSNPNRIDNIPEARKRLRQCSATK